MMYELISVILVVVLFWVAYVAGHYMQLLWIQRKYNKLRVECGLPTRSLVKGERQ